MKLTKKEKQILADAAELIETNKTRFSCIAINRAAKTFCPLKAAYCNFYKKHHIKPWFMGEGSGANPSILRSWRVMLLLWYREVGDLE